jgi:hypothetical protein
MRPEKQLCLPMNRAGIGGEDDATVKPFHIDKDRREVGAAYSMPGRRTRGMFSFVVPLRYCLW